MLHLGKFYTCHSMVSVSIRIRKLKQYSAGVVEVILQQIIQGLLLAIDIFNEFIWLKSWALNAMNEL